MLRMITLFPSQHALHAPQHEYFRGQLVPCFESPARAQFVELALREAGHELRQPKADSRSLLAQVHSARYLAFLETAWARWLARDAANAARQPFPSVWPTRTLRSDVEPANFIAQLGLYSFDNGTPLTAGTWAAVKAGADCALEAAQLLQQGQAAVLCATRPPGHHAGADFMGGYCFLNNAALAAQALRNQGAARVAVLDVDYHHGNGTQSIFYDRNDVLVVNLHRDPSDEYPFYLGHADETGGGAGLGFNLNLPLPAGTDGPRWFEALATGLQALHAFKPDALVVSLGLDTFHADPLTSFALQSADYERLGEQIAQLKLPTVLVLEGGYAASELGTNLCRVLQGMA
jgi:acetoin utilization deacetylase AcuC-like enzyme